MSEYDISPEITLDIGSLATTNRDYSYTQTVTVRWKSGHFVAIVCARGLIASSIVNPDGVPGPVAVVEESDSHVLSSPSELLDAVIDRVSPDAAELGVRPGMFGRDALECFIPSGYAKMVAESVASQDWSSPKSFAQRQPSKPSPLDNLGTGGNGPFKVLQSSVPGIAGVRGFSMSWSGRKHRFQCILCDHGLIGTDHLDIEALERLGYVGVIVRIEDVERFSYLHLPKGIVVRATSRAQEEFGVEEGMTCVEVMQKLMRKNEGEEGVGEE